MDGRARRGVHRQPLPPRHLPGRPRLQTLPVQQHVTITPNTSFRPPARPPIHPLILTLTLTSLRTPILGHHSCHSPPCHSPLNSSLFLSPSPPLPPVLPPPLVIPLVISPCASPFPPRYVFPGIGLAASVAGVSKITDRMLYR